MGEVVGSGEKPLQLRDGEEARASLSFTPPRFGAYSLVADYKSGEDVLASQAIHFGVTRRFDNVPELREGESKGGWEDAPRQMFCGLRLMRLHPGKGDDKLLADLDSAKQNGATVLVQLTDKKADLTPEYATKVMQEIKGRVCFVELFNEPNFSFKPEEYTLRAQAVYDAIKAVDPTVQVLGPAVCGISLSWHEEFYKAGGKTTCDICRFTIMKATKAFRPTLDMENRRAARVNGPNGDADKPIWQTERAISSMRGVMTGFSQAIRVTLHRDVLSSLGIPDDHNSHYYLNQGGYSPVPSYEWSAQGPLPAALATRTRAAMIGARHWTSKLNFGPTGNTLFLGEIYRDTSGATVSLRNIVGAPMTVESPRLPERKRLMPGAIRLLERFKNGTLRLSLSQLPTYVRFAGNGTLSPKPWNWGRKCGARRARFGRRQIRKRCSISDERKN